MDVMTNDHWRVKVEFELFDSKEERMTGSFDFIVDSKFSWSWVKKKAKQMMKVMVKEKARLTNLSLSSVE